MLKRLIAYTLFILGFLTVTFFRHYSGELIPHPFLFWLLGIALFYGGYLTLRYSSSEKEQDDREKFGQIREELKLNGEKIRINLPDCEILEHDYLEERDPDDPNNRHSYFGIQTEIGILDALTSDPGARSETSINQSVLVFRYNNPRTGAKERFVSRVIPKERISLSICLDAQKNTTLYVDKSDRSRYFFDLDFLKET